MANVYWARKLIDALRWASGKSWMHILNEDLSITSLKVGTA